MRRRWLLTCIITLSLGLLLTQTAFLFWWHRPSVNPYLPVYVYIQPGSSLKHVAKQLAKAGVISHANYFIWLVRLHDASRTIKAGEYIFAPNLSPAKIYKQLIHDRVMQHPISLIEGWTFTQFIANLNSQTLLIPDLKNLSPQQIMQQIDPHMTHPEGMFFPDTYFYTRNTKASVVLKTSYNKMQVYLAQAWAGRAPDLPYKTPYDALIVASLIEKETANPEEKPLVASVIINRLRKNMPLQIDPTIIYGLGDRYNGDITSQDLKANTPYNTYRHRGLPPTPIAMPSASSIMAALHPAQTNYLYFVANSPTSHQFSTTLIQHDKAVKAYLHSLSKN